MREAKQELQAAIQALKEEVSALQKELGEARVDRTTPHSIEAKGGRNPQILEADFNVSSKAQQMTLKGQTSWRGPDLQKFLQGTTISMGVDGQSDYDAFILETEECLKVEEAIFSGSYKRTRGTSAK
ncbi:hypothetical protein L7F22_044471 [Adiantum nelumboides]|nr:hypothetical protein [Adiantum nelumboides]